MRDRQSLTCRKTRRRNGDASSNQAGARPPLNELNGWYSHRTVTLPAMPYQLPHASDTDNDSFAVALPAAPEYVRTARHKFAQWLSGTMSTPARMSDILLAVGEAVTNSVEHGSQLDPARLGVDAGINLRRNSYRYCQRPRLLDPSTEALRCAQPRPGTRPLPNQRACQPSRHQPFGSGHTNHHAIRRITRNCTGGHRYFLMPHCVT